MKILKCENTKILKCKNSAGLKNVFVFLCFCVFALTPNAVMASISENEIAYAVYFTGVGCSHCAKTDPVILVELLDKKNNFAVIEYEIYQQKNNAVLFNQCCENYDLPACRPFGPTPCKGIPLICFSNSHNDILTGDSPILKNIEDKLSTVKNNQCALLDGPVSFADLDFNQLPGNPKIWINNKILIKNSNQAFDSQTLKSLLLRDNLKIVLNNQKYSIIDSQPVMLSGSKVEFEHAINLAGWIFQWNGNEDLIESAGNASGSQSNPGDIIDIKFDPTLAKIISLAAVDAVNPCALAVLILMLTAIISYNPRDRKNIILAGLAFVASVFAMYLIYGLIIIKFLQIIQALTAVRLWLYKILGTAAIILGILNIRDFIKYKPGRLGTEMPLFMRPKAQKIISGITSPAGAFSVGIFVTLFLLPCTIGPYIIAGGILSAMEIVKTIPPLLLYNLIFVAPMLIIIGIVYWGFRNVEDISAWKEKNISKLHLVAGIIMLGLGVAMVMGLV
ncbi:MAG: cytochrome c biogenesis CcdA family protein [Patescibacteria group bacterium]|nr:cytochrome c biogenesis CcdA family protein [Patescibacteria group bacterium]